jgi:hypothetical protein
MIEARTEARAEVAEAAPLIEAARARYDLAQPERQFAWSRLGIAAELLRIAAGRPKRPEEREISLPQRMDESKSKNTWPDWDALCRLAILDARLAIHDYQIGRAHVFFPAFELFGPPTRLALRAAHCCLAVSIAFQQGVPALRQYSWLLPAAEEVLGKDHAELGILHHNLSMLQSFAGQMQEALADEKQATVILSKALGEQHPTTLAVSARLNQLDDNHKG